MNNHEAFWEYVHHLTPPERKRLQFAWHSDVQKLERVHPALLNWTKQYRLARLISIGLFSEHSVEGTQTLVSLAGLDIHPREFEGVLEYSLETLSATLVRWVKLLPKDAGVDHQQLHRDLIAWTYPNQFVQRRWAREFFVVQECKDGV